MMLQSSLDWLWKLVVWGGLEFKMYIFKVVWFGFGPVAQTITRVSGTSTWLARRNNSELRKGILSGVDKGIPSVL